MSDKYNGWTNYETWLVKLWMDNDPGSQSYYREMADSYDEVYDLSEALKDDFEEGRTETVGVYEDLLTSALSRVNWYEIAEVLKDDN